MFDLSSKIIIITGGAGLLGSRLAEIIISNNGTPIILDNDNKKIVKLKIKEGYNFIAFSTDFYFIGDTARKMMKLIKK